MNTGILFRRIGIALLAVALVSVIVYPTVYSSRADTQKVLEVPITNDALFPWLQDHAYAHWYHEAEIHPSAGPHGDVLTYFNPILEQSMKSDNTEHPAGSASVKELYTNGELSGWSVMVKELDSSADGMGWYWYTVTSATDPSQIVASGEGASACLGCHGSGGKDFIMSTFPFANGVEQTELPPATASDLLAWLKSGTYSDWAKESAIHASVGPHGDVLVYINPVLEQSMKAGQTVHPMNSASVKELYTSGQLDGWVVMIKTQDDSAGGDGWYWFLTKNMVDASQAMVADHGVTGCANCHATGTDFIHTAYPLR
jgi:cytochrome c553